MFVILSIGLIYQYKKKFNTDLPAVSTNKNTNPSTTAVTERHAKV